MKPFNKLKNKRTNSGFRQEDIGELINKNKSSYNKRENGKVPFDIFEAKKIADFFDETIDSLFFDQ